MFRAVAVLTDVALKADSNIYLTQQQQVFTSKADSRRDTLRTHERAVGLFDVEFCNLRYRAWKAATSRTRCRMQAVRRCGQWALRLTADDLLLLDELGYLPVR